jgi:TRAP-type C4-dicarboxylate transport system permease small subunit
MILDILLYSSFFLLLINFFINAPSSGISNIICYRIGLIGAVLYGIYAVLKLLIYFNLITIVGV